MLMWLGIIVLVGHAISLVMGHIVSGFLYPDSPIGLLPDSIPATHLVVDGLAVALIIAGIVTGA